MVAITDHGTWRLRPDDERLHEPGPQVLWNESYYFDFAAADGSMGGYVRLGLYPNWNRAWYWACLVNRDRPLILVADNNAPLPSGPGAVPGAGQAGGAPHATARGTTGRGTTALITDGQGYAAAQQVLRPLQAARLTLDATEALVLADPVDAYDLGLAVDPGAVSGTGAGTGTGTEHATVPFGIDLEWTTVAGVYPYRDTERYEIPCRIAGTIRVGDERIAFTGYGERDHSWGERDWWSLSWLWTAGHLRDGTAFHGVRANLGFPLPWPSFVAPPGGALEHRDGFRASTRFGPDRLPVASRLRLAGMELTVKPLCFAPVGMRSPEGAAARFPRAMCRFEAADGRTGYGWTEWHQPPGWRDHDWSGADDAPESPTQEGPTPN